jgi:hypothetical protein
LRVTLPTTANQDQAAQDLIQLKSSRFYYCKVLIGRVIGVVIPLHEIVN